LIVSPSLNSTFLPAGTTSLSPPARPTWENSPAPASRETANRELPPDRGAYRQESSLPAGRERAGSRGRKEQGKT